MHGNARASDHSTRLPIWGLLSLSATALMAFSTEIIPAGILPLISRDLGVSQSQAGQFVTAYAISSTVVALPLALAFRRLSKRVVLFWALGGFALANLVTAFSDDYFLSLVARVLAGVAGGLSWAVVTGYGTRISPPDKRGRALSIVVAGGTVALAFGLPLGTVFAHLFGWRPLFVSFSVLAIILIPWTARALPVVGKTTDDHKPLPLRHLLKRPGIVPALAATLLILLGHSTLYTYIAPFADLSGFTGESLGYLLLAFGLASLVGLWVTGVVIDHHLRTALLVGLTILAVAAAALGIFPWSVVVVCAGVFIWGVFFGGASTLTQTGLFRATPTAELEISSAMMVTVYNGGVALGSLAGGLLLDSFGATVLPWAFLVALVFAGAIVVSERTVAFTNRSM